MQTPPMYSALKRDGKRLYQLARKGQAVALEPRRCRVDDIEYLGREDGDVYLLRVRQKRILAVLDSLEASGGTYGEGGIRMAYELARETYLEGGNNRVLLFTDGDFNLGQTDDSELVSLVRESAGENIFLSIFGLGSGNYNDALAQIHGDLYEQDGVHFQPDFYYYWAENQLLAIFDGEHGYLTFRDPSPGAD